MRTKITGRSRNPKRYLRSIGILLVILILGTFSEPKDSVVLGAAGCASSSPSGGAYTVNICITAPADGATLTGNKTVTITVTVTGTNPGIMRVVSYLDGQYLLTDYQSPYTYTIPTANFVDGSHSLGVEALMRDAFTTPNRATITNKFQNGVTSPPVNNKTFTPSKGTNPPSGSPLVVAAAGDGASGEANAAKVSDMINSWNPNLLLYLGDVYEKGSYTEFFNWYGLSGSLWGRFRSITNPTIGNHEYTGSAAPGYFFYWDNVPNFYSYTIGKWHFVSLNANHSRVSISAGSAQYNFVQADLTANTAPCTIVYYHQPFFNVGPEGSTTQLADVWKLFVQHHVTLVLNGHDHDYQRWTPLNGSGASDPNGVTEIIAGTGGHGIQHFITTDSRMLKGFDTSPNGEGALRLALSSSSLTFNYFNLNGTLLDSGTINCSGSVPPPTPTPTRTSTLPSGPTATQTPTLAGPTPTRTPTISGPTQTRTPTSPAGPTPTRTPTRTATPSGASITFTPQADAYVDASNTTSNFGTSKSLLIDGSPVKNSYIRFNVTGLSGKPIKATLRIFANSTSTTGYTVKSVSDNSWGETTITFANAPAMGGSLGSSGAIPTANTFTSVDITSFITGNGQFSVAISTTNSTQVNLASKESGANAPQLVIQQ